MQQSQSAFSAYSQSSLVSEFSATRTDHGNMRIGMYKGALVAVRMLTKTGVLLTRDDLLELKCVSLNSHRLHVSLLYSPDARNQPREPQPFRRCVRRPTQHLHRCEILHKRQLAGKNTRFFLSHLAHMFSCIIAFNVIDYF
jgi:hypothetical protein